MNNDYDKILSHLLKVHSIETIAPGVNFIDVREVDEDAYLEVKDYFPLILGLYDGSITANRFVREAMGIIPIKNGIMATALSNEQTDVRILR